MDTIRIARSRLAGIDRGFRRKGAPAESKIGVLPCANLYRKGPMISGLGHDLRLAVRGRERTLSMLAAVSLALGIGATTAIFSLVSALLLQKLPVVDPDRLVAVTTVTASNQGRVPGWTYPIWEQIRGQRETLGGAFAWSLQQRFTLLQGDEQTGLDGFFVSGEAFQILGVRALAGRMFEPGDDVRGGGREGPVAVISAGLWKRRFGGDPKAIGTSIVVDRVPVTIVGVAPQAFFGIDVGQSFDVLLPFGVEPLLRGKATLLDGRGYWVRILLRLKPDQSIAAATAAVQGLQPAIRAIAMPPNAQGAMRQNFLKEPFTLVDTSTGTSFMRQQYRRPLFTMLGVAGLVLLVACGNIANLLFARGTARRHEMAVRVALGASKWRLVRQSLVESVVLAAIGAGAGLGLAVVGSRLLVAQLATFFDHVFLDVSLDVNVMLFTMMVTAITVLLFGVGPALRATRVHPSDTLMEHRSSTSRHATILSRALVVLQVALSLVLTIIAGLLIQTFVRLAQLPLGFDDDRVLVVYTGRAQPPPDRAVFHDTLLRSVTAVPGVSHGAMSLMTPISGLRMSAVVNLPDAPTTSQADRTVNVNYVSPGWFATYGTPLLEGRDISPEDAAGAPAVLVVNRAFVRKFYPRGGAVGATIPANAGAPQTIVGVVGDAAYRSLREEVQPTIYMPLAQSPEGAPDISLSVRYAGTTLPVLQRDLASALAHVDSHITYRFLPLSDQVGASLTRERLVALLSGFFGVVALLLSGVGVYGVTSYAVARQRKEMGILIALGATPGRVRWLVLSRVLTLLAVGITIGTGVGLWVTRGLTTLLYGLPPRDPATIVGAAVLLGIVGMLAAWLPSRQAARTDPSVVFKEV
jgi:putative ABC transport system permease protein